MYLQRRQRTSGFYPEPESLDFPPLGEGRHRDSVISTLEHACVLFTDLVASTWLWEQDPDRMSAALTRHDSMLESTIAGHGGRVFKWTGDGCCASFPIVGDAPGAALALRDAFVHEVWNTARPLRLRVALHAGPVRFHRGNDLVGPTLNQTGRLLELCEADQVLSTAAGLRSLHPRNRGADPWRRRGIVKLRDVPRPVEVFEASGVRSAQAVSVS